ncbi:MAG: thioredoxin domain-containing protein [Halobacteriales archaeon]
MVTALERNRLAGATSPYLTAHADNPVNWQPWDEASLDAAERLDRPIFLSVGYAACHWCHVMAEESFEDDAVAERLNEAFVPIKVDREERPDLDRYYQLACQATTGRGGWPLSAWLTPDGRPFQLATYLPKRARRGQTGFIEALDRIATAWEGDRAAIERRADRIADAVETAQTDGASEDEQLAAPLQEHAGALLREVDWTHGGFGQTGPKFPNATRLRLLLRAWDRTGRDRYADALETTLHAMARGGIRDQLAGGFHRYATDRAWRVPHFEKMAYDNAQLLECYARAAVALDEPAFAAVAADTGAFLDRDLGHPEGGIYSSLDADADGEEGTTYAWTREAVAEALDDDLAVDLACARFGIDDDPDVAAGSVPHLARSVDELAEAFGLDTEGVEATLDRAASAMRDARTDRPQPARDEKVLATWTGLAASGFAIAGWVLDDRTLRDRGDEALRFVERSLIADSRLHRVYRDGTVAVPAFLEDYAAVARGAFHHYRATDDADSLSLGLRMVDGLLEACWDPEDRRLRFSPVGVTDGPPGELRDPADGATPSPVGLAIEVLAVADLFRPDEVAAEVLEAVVADHTVGPRGRPSVTLAVDAWDRGPPSLTIVGDRIPTDWRRRLDAVDPDLVVTRRPPGDAANAAATELGLSALPPIWRGRDRREDAPTVYPCRGRTCGRPTSDLEAALAWFDD